MVKIDTTVHDGVALTSVNHPVTVTPTMVEAGTAKLLEWNVIPPGYQPPLEELNDLAASVYFAMCEAAPEWVDISDDALETTEVDVILAPETIEEFAIKAALGNNGGEWATHYTEEQKEHWRQWVRDMAKALDQAPRNVWIAP